VRHASTIVACYQGNRQGVKRAVLYIVEFGIYDEENYTVIMLMEQ